MDEILKLIPEAFSGAIQAQVSQFTVAFALAAWIHSSRVKKEIKAQGTQFIDAVNNLTQALREDLRSQSIRIESVENRVHNLEVK